MPDSHSPTKPVSPRVPRLRIFRLLAALAVALPAALLAAYTVASHDWHQREGRERVLRTLELLHENGARVFDTYEVLVAYVDELVRGLSDEEVLAREPELNARLGRFKDALPQVQDIWILGSGGRPVASANVFPMPRGLDLSDREYFRVLRDGGPEPFVSDVLRGRASPDAVFFQFARRRSPTADGGFGGVIAVSVQPDYFVTQYGQTPASGLTTASLVRDDGYVLARYPRLGPDGPRRVERSTFATRIAESPDRGVYVGRSLTGGPPLILGYRRIPGQPVYVVTGLSLAVLDEEWRQSLVLPYAIGVPTAIALLALVWVAKRQTEGLRRAVQDLTAERALREAAAEERRRLQATEAQRQRMEALGKLAGGIAHDVNNVMQAVRSGASLIRRRASDPSAVDQLARMIEGASERGASVTRRLLAFARRGELRAEPVDPAALLADLEQVLNHTLGADVAVEVRAGDALPPLLVDKGQLETTLLNLATNARDAMPEGGLVTLQAAALRDPEGLVPGRYVALSVRDTGMGMDGETLARAAEPFFTTKALGQGTGLGLAMARGFAEQSGGALRIESEPGRGTCVSLLLPAASAEAVAPSPPAAPSAPALRLLLADDEDLVREAVAQGLEAVGHRVLRAATASAALANLDAGAEVDLLVTDLAMPDFDGFALIAAARERRPHLPALLLTGNAVEGGASAEALPPGPFELLRKPVAAEDLARRVAALAAAPTTV
jgi:signal transduction histidine kinase/ActR/RegA family two-component response regulator